jgi:transcriptional regulator with XRE-family HTH domain
VIPQDDVRDFLVARRAALTPEEAGLTDYGGRRRVPGLRRTEVAVLAGVSAEYYTRLERGKPGASPSMLDALTEGSSSEDALRLLASWVATDLEPATKEQRAHGD